MANEAEKLDWVEIDVATLPAGVKKDLEAYQTARRAAGKAKEAFETAFLAAARKSEVIDGTQTLKFSAKFGKDSVAVIGKEQDTRRKAVPAKPKFKL